MSIFTNSFTILMTGMFGLICGCKSNDQTTVKPLTQFHAKTPIADSFTPNKASIDSFQDKSQIADSLKDKKALIDSLFNRKNNDVIVLVKLIGKNEIMPFKDTILPDDTETSYNILKDSLGRVVSFMEKSLHRKRGLVYNADPLF